MLDTLPLTDYQTFSDLFEDDLYEAVKLETCVSKRISQGGTGRASVLSQIEELKGFLSA